MDGKAPSGTHDESSALHRDCGCFRAGKELVALETLDAQRLLGGIGISSARLSGLASRAAPHPGGDPAFPPPGGPGGGAAADRPEREITLARLAAKWGFPAEAEQLWL